MQPKKLVEAECRHVSGSPNQRLTRPGALRPPHRFPLQNSFPARAGLAQCSPGCYWFPRKPRPTDVRGSQNHELTACAFWISICKHGDSLLREREGGRGWRGEPDLAPIVQISSVSFPFLKIGSLLYFLSSWETQLPGVGARCLHALLKCSKNACY